MLRPARRIAAFCLFLLVALLGGLTRLQFVQAGALDDNEANQRATINRYSEPRGDILVAGRTITGSRKTEGDLAYERTYRQGPVYAPITGYASQLYGASLLEGVENDVLDGTDARLSRLSLLSAITRKPNPGGRVATTIDPNVQRAAYHGLQGRKGAVAAIEPHSGRVLALVSSPSFDPERFAGDGASDRAAWEKLSDDPDQPMLNRALRQTYPPGSTFKVVTAAAALDSSVTKDIDHKTDSPDPYHLPGTTKKLGNEADDCENATLRVAMQKSCNTVFAPLADAVGNEEMKRIAERFGFNDSDLTIPVRASTSRYPSTKYRAQTALSGIGQFNDTATPLQMAMVASGIANDGELMRPYLVDRLATSGGREISKTRPQRYNRVVSSSDAGKLQDMMEDVVTDGTGGNAKIPGAVVGGKTGTAQHGVDNTGTPYAWFISYAKPSKDEQAPVAVAAVVEDGAANREDISGGGLAAPIAKAVMTSVLEEQ